MRLLFILEMLVRTCDNIQRICSQTQGHIKPSIISPKPCLRMLNKEFESLLSVTKGLEVGDFEDTIWMLGDSPGVSNISLGHCL